MTQRHPIQHTHLMMITTVTINRIRFFNHPMNAQKAVECLYKTKNLHPFHLYGFVIMPDHCHFLVRVDAPDTVSYIMNCYKSLLQFEIGVPKLWQRRFHMRIVYEPMRVLEYIHQNPIKARLCMNIESYLWSSAHTQWNVELLP